MSRPPRILDQVGDAERAASGIYGDPRSRSKVRRAGSALLMADRDDDGGRGPHCRIGSDAVAVLQIAAATRAGKLELIMKNYELPAWPIS
jgi:hypothetical protein